MVDRKFRRVDFGDPVTTARGQRPFSDGQAGRTPALKRREPIMYILFIEDDSNVANAYAELAALLGHKADVMLTE